MRGSWRTNRTVIFWPPLLWASALCLSRYPGLLKRRPRGPLCWVMASLLHLFSNFFGPQLIRALRPLRPDVAFPTTSRHSLFNSTATSVLTELYNSSTSTQSPTRSLKLHVWSSSSGNNFHTVHRSLSSGASVYECTLGIFLARPISSANFRPRDFLSWLPLECVTSFRCITLEWYFGPGRRPKYNNLICNFYQIQFNICLDFKKILFLVNVKSTRNRLVKKQLPINA